MSKKLVASLRRHQLPKAVQRQEWKDAALAYFSPYFRRQSQLRANLDSFMIELRNLARILGHQEHLRLLDWCLALQRRVIRNDRAGGLELLRSLIVNMQRSDERWLNLFETSAALDHGAAVHDRAFQIFQTIDGVAEGCFKPQLQILYAFAVRDSTGKWPTQVDSLDFGALVAGFPANLRGQVPILLNDPDLGLPVNQWRNVAAHRTFTVVGPRTIEVRYGKGGAHVRRFGLHRLRTAWHWLLKTHSAVRLANTIIYVEYMQELHSLGIPKLQQRMSATLMHVSHGLSTVGFETVSWEVPHDCGVLTVRDRLQRELRTALIHASQQLVPLAVGVLSDVATQTRIKNVSVLLLTGNGERFGTATVAVRDADAFSRRKLPMSKYIQRISFSTTAGGG